MSTMYDTDMFEPLAIGNCTLKAEVSDERRTRKTSGRTGVKVARGTSATKVSAPSAITKRCTSGRAAEDPGAKPVKYTFSRMLADAADDRLRSNVHPPDWINPEPRGRYHLAVVGGGTAGLVSAMGAAGLGARVALVERALLGGDCLVTGCVPSKAIVRSARAAADARRAEAVGVRVAGVEADFGAVMRRMRERRADISPHDSASRLRSAGVDVYFGDATLYVPFDASTSAAVRCDSGAP